MIGLILLCFALIWSDLLLFGLIRSPTIDVQFRPDSLLSNNTLIWPDLA